ncbi:related to Elongator complex protein 2 [Saccharomycodes ludwigii]|uniref:Elongator complex protein 2 n=1 Tax=Saccharomycodes ludwigii TaxID=36035 RepID=A0A376B645_9ASCO|nr:related to Elongator complex protein 2 [Saccharomycodes ludwigii]
MSVTSEAIFIGANHQSQISDYNKARGIVAYGAGSIIALWKPLEASLKGVFLTLKGHTSLITCVRFISNNILISACEDKLIKIWKFDETNDHVQCCQTIDHYQHSITCLTTSRSLGNIFVTGSTDGSLSIWTLNKESTLFELKHEFTVKRGVFPLTVSLQTISEQDTEENLPFILAVGGTSVNLFIYSFELNTSTQELSDFKQAAVMEGHEDWIKSLDIRKNGPGSYLLASGSQDRYIRLWKLSVNEEERESPGKLTLLSNKKYMFEIGESTKVTFNFEALIMGHDDWVSSIQWHESKLQLLACTADTAVMVWEPDELSGVWICSSRLGELSSKGASTATGSVGGFWSCLWFTNESNEYILTNGKTGSFRMWSRSAFDGEDRFKSDNDWIPRLGITGSTKPVTDVAWSSNGYLLSTSLDQTTRLFSKWIYNADGSERKYPDSWFEFARPQIHGYDMICVEPISDTRFVSAGDEKILRSFDEPRGVAQLLAKFSGLRSNEEIMPESASLPVLGLSNKAVTDDPDSSLTDLDPNEMETDDNKNISYAILSELQSPPLEDQLQRHTLWPEIEKLYGHGYEIVCADVSPDKKLIGSACRSNTYEHATIRVFDTDSWLQIKPALPFHDLTVTRVRFSKDNKHLLSVSRDRRWAVWSRNEDNTFTLKCKNEKPHTRIIWDCDWCPLSFADAFVTASRDKTIKIWKSEGADYTLWGSIKLSEPITAISVLDQTINTKIVIVAGCESGAISVYTFDSSFQKVLDFDISLTPSERIGRIRWKPYNKATDKRLFLAAASSDHSCRIYSLDVNAFRL